MLTAGKSTEVGSSADLNPGMGGRGGGGVSTPLYKPYRYVPPHRVRFLHHFGLESGLVFEKITGVYDRI